MIALFRKVIDMTIYGYFRFAAALAVSGVVAPGVLFAQPAIAPATTVRVIEIVDSSTGERRREVAEDLTAPEISRIQGALASAGFDPGRATGQMTSTTRIVLGRFQASRGLVRCECVSYETLVALGIRPLVVATITAPLQRGYGSEVVFVPQHRGRGIGFGHQPAVVVGHGPSVFVGHDPARGAGDFGRRPHVPDSRPHMPDGGPHVLDPRPPRPRPGSSISGSGAEIRALTPRRSQPRPPFPGSATAP